MLHGQLPCVLAAFGLLWIYLSTALSTIHNTHRFRQAGLEEQESCSITSTEVPNRADPGVVKTKRNLA